ncbi:CPBP family intramembrane glutamic endopeptidase [Hoylesella shahii]|uniref:CPBP family intramembrane glutamic endopeptidase n=1 Tax=Hoylesella shahii TaxID=228603 RepID=UPI00277D12C9|nr:CPBP family intramembrane glutamic endopeptidase [Hoylesella shahii]
MGVVEEVVFRGILFRLITDKWNIAVGLTTSSLLFGLAHLGNPGATLWAALAIALASGCLFGMAYATTKQYGYPSACTGHGTILKEAFSAVPYRVHP